MMKSNHNLPLTMSIVFVYFHFERGKQTAFIIYSGGKLIVIYDARRFSIYISKKPLCQRKCFPIHDFSDVLQKMP